MLEGIMSRGDNVRFPTWHADLAAIQSDTSWHNSTSRVVKLCRSDHPHARLSVVVSKQGCVHRVSCRNNVKSWLAAEEPQDAMTSEEPMPNKR